MRNFSERLQEMLHRLSLFVAVLAVLAAPRQVNAAQHPPAVQKPVNEQTASLLTELEASRNTRTKAVSIVKKDTTTTRALLDELREKFDGSVHSARTRPEQRKVNYDSETLALGIWIGDVFAAATGDRVPYRLFQARKTRMEGTELLNARRYRPALAKLGAALREAEQLKDGWLTIITRLNMAYAYIEMGQGQRALALCEEAVRDAESMDARVRALALIDLASAHTHLSDYAAGIKYGEAAAQAAHEAGIRLWEGNALLNVGVAYRQLGNLESAQTTLEQALEVISQTQDRLGLGRTLYNLATLAIDRRQHAQAAEYLERALPLIRDLDLRHSHEIELEPAKYYNIVEENALRQLVSLYSTLNQSDKAAEHQASLDRLLRTKPGSASRSHH